MTTAVRETPAAKRALMTEGLRLFASHGVEAVSVRDIARATCFSNPVLFRHFDSKEALARALFEACYRRLIEALEASETHEGLEAWLAAALKEIDAAPEAVLFVLDNLKRYFATLPEDLQQRNLPAQVTAMVRREQAAGRMRGNIDIRLSVVLITGALGQLARSAHFRDQAIDATSTAKALARLLGDGFSPREAPP